MSKDGKKEENWDDLDDEMEEEEEEMDEEESEEEDDESWDEEEEASTEEVPVDIDPEDESIFPERFYTTTTNGPVNGKDVPAGTQISVRCENCAVWKTPLSACGGKALCKPGLPAVVPLGEDGTETHKWRMAPHRFSCQQYFIPTELSEVLTHVTADPDYVRGVLWAFPAIKALTKLQERIASYYEKHNLGDPTKTTEGVLDFALLFSSPEQAEYVKPFVKYVYENIKKRRTTAAARPKAAFQAGAEVTWDDPGTGKRVSGIIRSIGGAQRLITLLVSGVDAQTLQPEFAADWLEKNPDTSINVLTVQMRYKFEEWKETRNPAVVSEAVVFDDISE